jgi:hypothetical protein
LPAYELYGEGPEVLLDRSAKVLTPDVVKDELAVDERIDAIKRLVQTKAMKQSPGQIALESICGEKTVATAGATKTVRRRTGNSAAGVDLP